MAGYTQNSNGGYDVNYEDERFKNIEQEKVQKETNLTNSYDNMINNSEQNYNNQIKATQDYAEKQKEIQQANTDFAIEQIEQQKQKAQKDYIKEQQGSYVDYMKQTKSNAQNMANGGLSNTGYSESSLVSMYNTYQNRVGTAKESLNNAVMNYNNSITQAMLANNEALAKIAFEALQTEIQLNQQAFEYKNALLLQKENALQTLNDTYYARYQNVLAQINNEIDLQMELDKIDREYEQWEREFAEQKEQRRIQKEQWEREFALTQRQINASIAETNAQASYYRAQASAKSSETTNPYGQTTKPMTISGSKVTSTGKNASDFGLNSKYGEVYKANNKFYVWYDGQYLDITSNITESFTKSANVLKKLFSGGGGNGGGSGGGGGR